MRIIEIPEDGFIKMPIMCGGDTVGERRIDLRRLPTIDAVPVVRCKDCKHYHQYHVGKMKEPSGWGKCKLIDMDVDMTVNDFCSHGERKDNG